MGATIFSAPSTRVHAREIVRSYPIHHRHRAFARARGCIYGLHRVRTCVRVWKEPANAY